MKAPPCQVEQRLARLLAEDPVPSSDPAGDAEVMLPGVMLLILAEILSSPEAQQSA